MAGVGIIKKIRKMTGKKGIQKNIGAGLMEHVDKLAKMVAKGNRNEEETRRWIIDVLVDAFGYRTDQIETELKALGKRVDIAIISKGKVLMIIECKASNVGIKQAAINQAANYATSLGAEWAAITNGQSWRLFHVGANPGEEANLVEIFDVGILDEDGISKTDVECLFMMTEQALTSGETMKWFHFNNCTSEDNVLNALVSDNVLEAIKAELVSNYNKKYGVGVEDVSIDYLREIIAIWMDCDLEYNDGDD